MTRTDVMASSRPQTAGSNQSSRETSGAVRRISVIPAVLLLMMALALPSAALAATETNNTSGYNQTPTTPTTSTPTTSTPTTSTPSTGTSPSKEASTPTTSTPSKGNEPTSTTPASTETAKSGTLPFTGFDLRWSIGFGLVLMGAGFAIVMMQRRQGRDGR